MADFRIRDESGSDVESQLATLVAYVRKTAEGTVSRAEKPNAWRRAFEEEQQARALSATDEAHRKMALQIEAARAEDLVHESCAWQRANAIRQYADAVLMSSPNDKRVIAWATWAMNTADSLDPLLRRLQQIEAGAAPAEVELPQGDKNG
ncbi:hypothetical protein NDR89_15535 [Cupriavidus gilardii]|uniref:Terminase small subunit n=1 Tax=Cupriavidus gilardii TaxID=82541 RepID=A0ABY4VVR9_9BURK|nr:hypothetical protein [Cupriavidus gilardii]USE81131.1 hypothetical protein NDR89_15535 [Cupriavidus gilardii]